MHSTDSTEAGLKEPSETSKSDANKHNIWVPKMPTFIEGDIKKFPRLLYWSIKRHYRASGSDHIICSTALWPRQQSLFQYSSMRSSTWTIRRPSWQQGTHVEVDVPIPIGRFRCEDNRQVIVVQHDTSPSNQFALIKHEPRGSSRSRDGGTRTCWTVWSRRGWETSVKITRWIAPPLKSVIGSIISNNDDQMRDAVESLSEPDTAIPPENSVSIEPLASDVEDIYNSRDKTIHVESPSSTSLSTDSSIKCVFKGSQASRSSAVSAKNKNMIIQADADMGASEHQQQPSMNFEPPKPLSTLTGSGKRQPEGRASDLRLIVNSRAEPEVFGVRAPIVRVYGEREPSDKSPKYSMSQSESSPSRPSQNIIATQQTLKNSSNGTKTSPSETPAIEKAPTLTTSYQSPAIRPSIEFVFKAAENSPVLRKRSYAQCRSIQMLYSQAAAAGIAASDTTLLYVRVAEQGKQTVVKDDHADFERIKMAINEAERLLKEEAMGNKVMSIVVTPWTWSF